MNDKTTAMVLAAIILFLSLSLTEFERYKDARLRALYGDDYYRYVYFVDEIRYDGIEFEV